MDRVAKAASVKIGLPLLIVLAALGGCNRQQDKPTGDVVATVDGRDITRTELMAEAQAQQIDWDAAAAPVRKALLERVIARTMLVQAAKANKLDRKPELLGQRLRTEAELIAGAEAKRRLDGIAAPTTQEIAAYQAANPQMFAKREALVVNQVQFMTGPKLPNGGRTTIDGVIAQLGSLGVAASIGKPTIDSAQLPLAAVNALHANPDVPILINNGKVSTFMSLISASPNPAAAEQQREVAINAIQNRKLEKSIADGVAQLRKEKKVTVSAKL